MPRSSSKGHRGEHAWAKVLEGKKISRRGYEGPDVESPEQTISGLTLWEVKVRASLPVWLEDWMDQTKREGAHALAVRRNRGEWWVLVPASSLVAREAEA